MNSAATDVVGIGNAIVDVIAHADEAFLAAQGFAKGAMTLIDAERAESLYAAMGPAIESSGGSAGNTMAGLASLGGAGAYIGKVRDDLLGGVFRHDITAIGVRFDTPAATEGPATARCLILVTADGQRTMGTYLGACAELGPADIEAEVIAGADITYLEGYLFDPPQAQAAFRRAAAIAHGTGRRVALSLSDPFCVARHRAAFRELVSGDIDILFANEAEICSLYEIDDFAAATAAVRGLDPQRRRQRDPRRQPLLHGRRQAGGAGRRHDGGRRPLCRGLSVRLDPRAAAPHLRQDRQPVRRRNHQPCRGTARNRAEGARRGGGPALRFRCRSFF